MTDMDFLPASELVRRFAAGTLSPIVLAEHQLGRLARFEKVLNAFRIVDEAGALRAARDSASRWQAGAPLGALDGVPVTVKDNLDMAGFPTRHGSMTSPPAPVATDSPAVARLRAAGAVILGKTNLPEFGWKALTDSPLAGITRNPWNPDHTPGGSSGGGAAATAAGIGTIALGNDGGGSVRGPASFSGLVGMKPSLGRVPHLLEGIFATLVAEGPLALTVADAAAATAVLAAPDARDWHSLPPPAPGWLDGLSGDLAEFRFAWSPDLGEIAPDSEVAAVMETAIGALRQAGASIDLVGPVIPPLEPRFSAYWFAGFARRMLSIPPARRCEMDPVLRRHAESGLAIDIAALMQSELERAVLWRRFAELHRGHDILLTPTMPHAAPRVETEYHTARFDRWRDGVPYTLPFNLTGQPALTLPCGVTPAGLPVGVQIVGARHADRRVLEAGLAIERALGFPQPHPVLAARLAG